MWTMPSLEDSLACEQLCDYASDRPHVDRCAIGIVEAEELGCAIPACGDIHGEQLLRDLILIVGARTRKTKITYLE